MEGWRTPQMRYLGVPSFGKSTYLHGWLNKGYPPPCPHRARRRGAIMRNRDAGEEGGPSDGRLGVGRWWLAGGLVLAGSRPSTQGGGARRLSCHPHRPSESLYTLRP